jgi:hypothetical protein
VKDTTKLTAAEIQARYLLSGASTAQRDELARLAAVVSLVRRDATTRRAYENMMAMMAMVTPEMALAIRCIDMAVNQIAREQREGETG